jgi:hypothetical protein
MPTESLPRAKARVGIHVYLVAAGDKAVDADPGLRSGQALRRHDGVRIGLAPTGFLARSGATKQSCADVAPVLASHLIEIASSLRFSQ